MSARRSGSPRHQASELHRERILSAMVQVASEHGTESATVPRVIARAGVSRKTFYGLFENRDDCLTALVDEAVATATVRVDAADDPQASWPDRVRAGLVALLELVDEQPRLARLCIAQALAHPTVLTERRDVLDMLTRIIDEGRRACGAPGTPAPLAAESVLGGALGLIHAQLSVPDHRSLVEPLSPLMSLVVLRYLGASDAFEEQCQPRPHRFASG
jgi:AcrR family transcriptional regulator